MKHTGRPMLSSSDAGWQEAKACARQENASAEVERIKQQIRRADAAVFWSSVLLGLVVLAAIIAAWCDPSAWRR